MQILGRLFRDASVQAPSLRTGDELDRRLVRVLRVNPCLRRAHGYEEQLRTALAWSADYLGKRVAALPAPRKLNPQAWTADPCLRVFFGTAGQVAAVLADARELNGIFERALPSGEFCAVLASEMKGICDEAFATNGVAALPSAGQLRICETGRAALQAEIVDRLLDQLALEALGIVAKEASSRDMLECERALLGKRLGILQQMGIGMRSMAGGGPRDGAEAARLGAMLDESDHDLRGLGLLPDAFDGQLRRFCEVLLRPDLHVHVGTKLLRRSPSAGPATRDASSADSGATQMGVIGAAGSPRRELAILLVRVAVADVPRPTRDRDTAADAQRLQL